jgi:hypothetical protein
LEVISPVTITLSDPSHLSVCPLLTLSFCKQSEKLKAPHLMNTDLEVQVDHLGEDESGLRRKLLLQHFDQTNTRALKDVLDEKVEHLERVIASHDEMVSGLLKRQGYANLARKAACCCFKPQSMPAINLSAILSGLQKIPTIVTWLKKPPARRCFNIVDACYQFVRQFQCGMACLPASLPVQRASSCDNGKAVSFCCG